MAHQSSERNIPSVRDIFGLDRDKRSNRKEERALDDAQLARFQQLSLNRCFQTPDRSPLSPTHDPLGNGGNDSAISVGSTSEEDLSGVASSSPKKKKQQRSRREKVIPEPDVKHLERHLSMKKTIRKKIMRDLQQAFVEDPNEFRVEDISPEQLKAEINVTSLSFGTSRKKKDKRNPTESNFLDFLRAGSGENRNQGKFDDEDSGHGSPTRDLSTERFTNYEYLRQQQMLQQQQRQQQQLLRQQEQQRLQRQQEEELAAAAAAEAASKKTSFWKRLTTKGSKSKR
ncbi:unnamed protein product [Bemisia tabaci]|uniref:Uncharacterized protein n=1 Tax=Bemisia tabaci TaxID=7038 RepID=A0A9P0F6E3_BEMTA|nr:PREDICTED: trichohyalin-like [Bemisia tabaci]XP_018900198.1 PREDICTED: trichohyalin-like [Bemisia tabaci]CAH0390940.1 unnamed protein product [Bemisia tabaci]